MPVKFDIKLSSKDMFRFNMYQTYSGFQGWFSIILAAVIFGVAVKNYGTVETGMMVMYIFLGVFSLIYIPLTLWLKSKSAINSSDVLKYTLHYEVDEKGFHVSQEEANADLLWEQIYKMTATKSNVLVYSNRVNAYVIPREQLGDQYETLTKLAKEQLPKFRVKMK